MKLGVIPENLAERLALWFGVPPPGILESWLGIMAARAVMVATKLDISQNTVHNHVKGIYKKLGVSSRAELLAMFIQEGPKAAER